MFEPADVLAASLPERGRRSQAGLTRTPLMIRPTLAVLVLVVQATAQDLSGRLQPVSGLSSFDGYYDLATGRLMRGSTPPSAVGDDGCGGPGHGEIVYDNTCQPTSWLPLLTIAASGGNQPEEIGDYGAIPSDSFVTNEDCVVGCSDAYDIGQFTIAWCTQETTRQSATVRFFNPPRQACTGTRPTATSAIFSASLSALPRASVSGVTSCYSLAVYFGEDTFELDASDSFSAGVVAGDKFAWSISFPDTVGATGPVLAGDTALSAPCAPCAGAIWEFGGQTTNAGTGAGQDGFVFLEEYGGSTPPSGDCYHFGGSTPSGLYLELVAGNPCSTASCSTGFCNGVDGSTATCPCAPGSADSGCAAPIPPMQGGGLTSGVLLSATRQTVGPSNRVTMVSTGYPLGSVPGSVLFRNAGIDPMAPVVFGDGVRCVDGSGVVRIGGTSALAGSATHTFGHGTMAGSGTFFYQAWYRSAPASYCNPAAAFNLSSGDTLIW